MYYVLIKEIIYTKHFFKYIKKSYLSGKQLLTAAMPDAASH
jgi:hypothetical protein